MTDDTYNPDVESRSDYYDTIETMADVIEDEASEYHDELTEAVWEQVDSSRLVIYTHESIATLRYSDNQPEEWKHLVADGDSWQKVIQSMAFDVVRQDLYEELNRRDVEL